MKLPIGIRALTAAALGAVIYLAGLAVFALYALAGHSI